jgi:hypothetical protein
VQLEINGTKIKHRRTQNASMQSSGTNIILQSIVDKHAATIRSTNSVQGVAYESSCMALHLPLINADFRPHNSLTVVESSTNIHDVN